MTRCSASTGRQLLPEQEADQERDVAAQLQAIYDARTTDKILYLKADQDLQYSKVLDAIDIATHQRRPRHRSDQRSDAGHDFDGA